MPESAVIVCPISGEKLIPEKVWESQLPNGQPIRYGRFGRHYHWGQECEWSYLVQPMEQQQSFFL